MSAFDRSSAINFGLNPLNRFSESRHDASFIDSQRADPAARFLAFAGGSPVLHVKGERVDPLFTQEQVAMLGEPGGEIFLGQASDGAARFAVAFDKQSAERIAAYPGLEIIDLRSIALRGLIEPALLGSVGGANAMLNWHQRHRFCANCGAPSDVSMAGWRRDCKTCGAQHFPRVDPVVIMLTVDGDRCLLGRQPQFAAGMYSALAGFLEPGETIEDAVRREIKEESGITCSQVSYFASQPWPFPSSLMIGCFARAVDADVVVDRTELEDARWFTRQEVADMIAGTHEGGCSSPKPYAIAYHLMREFVEKGEGVLPVMAL
ncbi:MAG: NAD(+) diphosphatase [Burkholderiaceae bacterium]